MERKRRKPGINLRPSNMDRSFSCPASLYPEKGELLVGVRGSGGGPGDVGKVTHEVFRATAKGEPYDLAEICGRHSVDPKDVGYLQWAARQFVELLQREFDVPEWAAEEPLKSGGHVDHLELQGTPDLWGLLANEKTAVLADLKTGYSGTSCEQQLRAYADLIFSNTPRDEVETVVALVCWARDLEVQKWEWTRAQIDEWVAEVEERIFGWDGKKYTVGSHCAYCRRVSACPARSRELKAAQEMMLSEERRGETALVGEDFAKAWSASILIPKVVESWRNRVREQIQATGPVPLGDGKMLTLQERNAKPEIDAAKAATVLKDEFEFTDEELVACYDLRKNDAEEIVMAKAERGSKGKRKKEMSERLKEAGALVPKSSVVFKIVDMERPDEGGE